MKYVLYLFVLIFIAFAVVQYNDPDPLLWIGIYLYAAYCCGVAVKSGSNATLYWVGLYGFLLGGVQLFPINAGAWLEHEQQAKSIKMSLPFVEEARESLGLFICAAAMVFCLFVRKQLAQHQ